MVAARQDCGEGGAQRRMRVSLLTQRAGSQQQCRFISVEGRNHSCKVANMKPVHAIWISWLSFLLYGSALQTVSGADETTRLAQLDKFWSEVQAAVQNGDYERYRATCHPSGVLVSGAKKISYPLSKALAGWKQGFLDTQSGKMKAGVEFRFSQRWGDDTTAHETGIFHYWTLDANAVRTDHYVHFESLLVKENGWQTLMEYQKGPASKDDWEKLQSGK
jgi:hypothetical protein